jgi:hypothetical protein
LLILQWIGIMRSGAVTLFQYLLRKKDKKVTEARFSSDGNTVIVSIEGDNNTVTLPKQVYQLSKDIKVVENLKTVTKPVTQENGIEEATFIHNTKPQLTVNQETAKNLLDAQADSDEVEPQTFTAHIVIYGPILDPKSKKWKFKLANKVENIDISETHIAQDVIQRGGLNVGDTYKVKLQMTERQTATGAFVADYKVKEVLGFFPGTGSRQESLGLEDEK